MEEIKELIEQNLKLTQEIHETTKYIKKYIIWQQIFSVIKIIIIVIPLIIGIIYFF